MDEAENHDKPIDWRDVLWREWLFAPSSQIGRRIWRGLAKERPSAWAVFGLMVASFPMGAILGVGFALPVCILLRAWHALPLALAAAGLLGGLLSSAAAGVAFGAKSTYRHLVGVARVSAYPLCTRSFWGAVLGIEGVLAGLTVTGLYNPALARGLTIAFVALVTLVALTGRFYVEVSEDEGKPKPKRDRWANEPPWIARLLCHWWRGRPTPEEVQTALLSESSPKWAHHMGDVPFRRRAYRRKAISSLIGAVRSGGWRQRIRARKELIGRGAPAIEPLLLAAADGRGATADLVTAARATAAATRRTYGPDPGAFVCPRCLARYRRQTAAHPYESLEFIACPDCGRSADPISGVREIVCTLDSAGGPDPTLDAGTLRVNWLARASRHGFEGADLFDFDRVEILSATDQDVAHFLVDVANDTNPKRRTRYCGMECIVSEECALSEGTLQALRAHFRALSMKTSAGDL